jgi:hypothetical protein
MTTAINGTITSVEYIKDKSFINNDFELRLEGRVVDQTYTFSNLTDANGLSDCSPTIVLSLDLQNNTVLSGEYSMELWYGGEKINGRVLLVRNEDTSTSGTDIYSNVINL